MSRRALLAKVLDVLEEESDQIGRIDLGPGDEQIWKVFSAAAPASAAEAVEESLRTRQPNGAEYLGRSLAAFRRVAQQDIGRADAIYALRAQMVKVALEHLIRDDGLELSVASSVAEALSADVISSSPGKKEDQLLLSLAAECSNVLSTAGGPADARHTPWLDVAAHLVNALHGRDKVELDDDGEEKSGPEWRTTFLGQICAGDWRPERAATICVFYRSVAKGAPLTADEWSMASSRLCQSLNPHNGLKPLTVPPLVHQLLALATDYDCGQILRALSTYFSAKIVHTEQDDSTHMDSADLICKRKLPPIRADLSLTQAKLTGNQLSRPKPRSCYTSVTRSAWATTSTRTS